MFNNCKQLVDGPSILPALTLEKGCYEGMFYNCSKLKSAPTLPAIDLTDSCYAYMFYNYVDLSNINVSFIEWDDPNSENFATKEWLKKSKSIKNDTRCYFNKSILLKSIYGSSYIPDGWYDISISLPICFKFNNSGSLTINFTGEETHDGGITFTTTSSWNITDDISPKRQMQYSINKGETWTKIYGTTTTQSASEIWIMASSGNYNEEHSTEINEQTGYYQYQRKVWISLKPNNLCTVEGNLLSFNAISISE